MVVNGERRVKCFRALSDAKKIYHNWNALQLQKPIVEIKRNEQGIAVLSCRGKMLIDVQVDDDVYVKFIDQSCFKGSGGYPCVSISGQNRLLHRLIMAAEKDSIIDHIDGDIYNAQRSNLRVATHSQNSHNRKKLTITTSQFIGVRKVGSRFDVNRTKDGIVYYGGIYDDEKVAAWACDQLSIELYGSEFAKLNNTKVEGYKWVNKRAIELENDVFKKLQLSGVCKCDDGFQVRRNKDGKAYYGGCYKDKKVAACAADRLSIELFGSNFTKLNNIELEGYKWLNKRAMAIEGYTQYKKQKVE